MGESKIEEVSVTADLEDQGLCLVAWQIYWASTNSANEINKELAEKALKYLHKTFDEKLRVTH